MRSALTDLPVLMLRQAQHEEFVDAMRRLGASGRQTGSNNPHLELPHPELVEGRKMRSALTDFPVLMLRQAHASTGSA